MSDQTYFMVEADVVVNSILWNGDINTWTPPEGSTMLVATTTIANVWVLNADETAFDLLPVEGAGDIGFTWDGTELTTNQPKPEIPGNT